VQDLTPPGSIATAVSPGCDREGGDHAADAQLDPGRRGAVCPAALVVLLSTIGATYQELD
jgi:hypothetical protein